MTHASQERRRICGVAWDRALVRSLLLMMGGALLVLPAWLVLPTLSFAPTALSNRITHVALAFAVGVPGLAGVILVLSGLRWLLLAAWPPSASGIEADDGALRLRLGPFGRRVLDWRRMEISYSFDREDDPDEEPDPELLALDPEEEMRTRLPRLRHPDVDGDVRWIMLRFANVEESALASRLLPYFENARKARPEAGSQQDDGAGT